MHFFAQVSNFAHFCTSFIFCTFFETKYFKQRPFPEFAGVNFTNINKLQQAEKKSNNERRKEKFQ